MALTLFPKLATLALAVLISTASVSAQTINLNSDKQVKKLSQLQKQKLQQQASGASSTSSTSEALSLLGIQPAPDYDVDDHYTFVPITKFPLNKELEFKSTTPCFYYGDYGESTCYRAYFYKFTLTNSAFLTFNSNEDIYFNLWKEDGDYEYNEYINGQSLTLESGAYYLVIEDDGIVDDNGPFSAKVRISMEKTQNKAEFSFRDISLPFSENLYFHPEYNSRKRTTYEDGDYFEYTIEKGFKLVLTEDISIHDYYCDKNYDYCAGLRVYYDQDLEEEVDQNYFSYMFDLEQGNTYYLVFARNYNSDTDNPYVIVPVKLDYPKPLQLQFQQIAVQPNPYLQKLDFTPDAGAVKDGGQYLRAFKFTLSAPTELYFYGVNKKLGGELYLIVMDSEDYNDDDIWHADCGLYDDNEPCSIEFPAAGTYYLVLSDDYYYDYYGNYYSTYLSISTSATKPNGFDANMPASDIPGGLVVVFNSAGGSAVASKTVSYWGYATKPADPTKAGNTFMGWYNGDDLWNFAEDFVIENITLTARWDDGTPIRTPQIAANSIKAYAVGNSIMLQNLPKNAKVQVYNMNGKLVSSKSLNQVNQGSDMSVDVQTKGMYIVKVGKQALRVTVK